MPAVRAIVRETPRPGLPVLGARSLASSTSVPFQMRMKPTSAVGGTVEAKLSSRGFDVDQPDAHHKMSLPRRTFLRGMGVTLALPLLDAMVPAATALREDRSAPADAGRLHLHPARRRHGVVDAGGRRRELRAVADAASRGSSRFKDSLVVVSNLKRAGSVAEMHAAAASGWLSGAIPKRTEGRRLPHRHDDRSGASPGRSARPRRSRRSSSRPRTSPATSAAARPATAART